MYKYVLNSIVKISLMFAQYFEYYVIILRGGAFFRGHTVYSAGRPSRWALAHIVVIFCNSWRLIAEEQVLQWLDSVELHVPWLVNLSDIQDESQQVLFTTCSFAGGACKRVVPAIFAEQRCPLHTKLQPVTYHYSSCERDVCHLFVPYWLPHVSKWVSV